MSEFAESRSGYPKFFRASPFADKVARNASPVPALLAIAVDYCQIKENYTWPLLTLTRPHSSSIG